MRIQWVSVFVDDQEKALQFYTGVLGFIKKHDVPAGGHRWLTVVSPEDPEGPELLLEPNENPVARTYQEGLYEQGIPALAFQVNDIDAIYLNLSDRGVRFRVPPTDQGDARIAVFDDTCGNWVMLCQIK